MKELNDDEDRFHVYRTAHWIDQGLDIKAAQDMADTELELRRLGIEPSTRSKIIGD